MSFKIWLINVFLAALLVVFGFRIMHLWETEPQAMTDIPSPKKQSEAAASIKEKRSLLEERAYELMVRQNLFSPERKEYIPDAEPEKPEPEGPKISGEKIVLYGVIITDGRKTALINNPGGKLGEGKFLWVEEGQVMSNLEVMEIRPEEILLNDGSQEHQILLSEKKNGQSRRRQADKSRGPTVISGGSSPQKVRSSSTSSASDSSRSASGSSSSKSRKASSSSDSDDSSDSGSEDKYKLVDTPFGTRKVKVK